MEDVPNHTMAVMGGVLRSRGREHKSTANIYKCYINVYEVRDFH